MTLLARLLGLRVVVTHHGPIMTIRGGGICPFSFSCWGRRRGMRWSNGRIVISKVIADLVRGKYGVESALIPNGVVCRSYRVRSGRLRHSD